MRLKLGRHGAPAHPHIHRPRMSGPGHTAFAAGGAQAFRDPQTMAAPDQAFGAAMAAPPAASPQAAGLPGG